MATNAQVHIVKNGKSEARILVDKKDSTDLTAALLLQDFVRQISGSELKILPSSTPIKKNDIIIGDLKQPLSETDGNKIKEDGFCWKLILNINTPEKNYKESISIETGTLV